MNMDYRVRFDGTEEGPTGGILKDLPSPYEPHACGLMHLPRFLEKIRKHLCNELPGSYQRNFTKGFDGFLCLHLGIKPGQVMEIVQTNSDDEGIENALFSIFPEELRVHEWNRKLCQMGMSEMGREKLDEVKKDMGVSDRDDLMSFADLIDYDEGRIL